MRIRKTKTATRIHSPPPTRRYRGSNHAYHGRQLTIFAMYASYTGDTDLIVKYYERGRGRIRNSIEIRVRVRVKIRVALRFGFGV